MADLEVHLTVTDFKINNLETNGNNLDEARDLL
jgi:hypothetical protein